MSLDGLLREPLAAVRDDGFSARVTLRLDRAAQRRRLLLWSLVLLAALPFLALLPAASEPLAQLVTAGAKSPLIAAAAGALVLCWALEPRLLRF